MSLRPFKGRPRAFNLGPSSAPSNSVAPAITGNAYVGSTLTCSTGTWLNTPISGYSYQWKRGVTNVGTDQNTYVPVTGDIGSTITCTVTATNAIGSTSQVSNTTAAVLGQPVNTVAPAVTGTAQVGQTLTTTTGTWTGGSVTFAYQWVRNPSTNVGTNQNTYVPVIGDVGSTIRCVVTGSNAVGADQANSNNTAAVIAAAHRYWRINASDNETAANNILSIVEMQFHVGTNGFGVDAATGGTAAADSIFVGTSPASGGFDDIFLDQNNDFWASGNTAFPHWLSYDFGSGKNIYGVDVVSRATGSQDQSPTAFTIQYSDDNAAWTTEWTVASSTGWAGYEMRHYSSPSAASYTGSPHGAHRYWRVFVILAADTGAYSSATEIQFRATPGGANQATNSANAASGGFFAGFPPANAFDGSLVTFFVGTPINQSGTASTLGWVSYDFGSNTTVAEMTWRNRSDTSATQAPLTAAIQYSDDNSVWTAAWIQLGWSSWSLGETKTSTDPYYI